MPVHTYDIIREIRYWSKIVSLTSLPSPTQITGSYLEVIEYCAVS